MCPSLSLLLTYCLFVKPQHFEMYTHLTNFPNISTSCKLFKNNFSVTHMSRYLINRIKIKLLFTKHPFPDQRVPNLYLLSRFHLFVQLFIVFIQVQRRRVLQGGRITDHRV